jgi:mannan endo-1,4-beta-mannosidase
MKLIISMGDRYALGFWSTDQYAYHYSIVQPGTAGAQKIANAAAFYTDPGAIAYFDRRIKHVMAHRNKKLGNKPWSELDDVIYACVS